MAPEGRTDRVVSDTLERAFAAGARVFDLAPGVVDRVADTVTPQPVLAVVSYTPTRLEEVKGASMVMVCADIRDPGNAGTMIRTADAAGVGAVICCEGTVDPTNPKTVRASAGSLFHLPVVAGAGAPEVLRVLKGWGFTTAGAVVRGGSDYTAFDWRQPVAAVFGNESSGLGQTVGDLLDVRISIPMTGLAESLNVASSAAVLCFEALRQRRTHGGTGTSPRPTVTGSTIQGMTDPPTGDGSP